MTVGGGFNNIQVLLTANNSNLRMVLGQSSAQIAGFERRVAASNNTLGKTGVLLGKTLVGGAVAAAAALAYSVKEAVEFDKAMRNVNSLAGLSETAFASLEKKVVSMSTRLPQSATTLAEGLYDIQSSGFAGADAMKVLEASALSASAGLTTTEVSAKAIAATLNAYGLQAGQAADVSDVLFQTVNAGVISFDELASNLGDVVGGAAAAKVGIDQVGSAIAAMTLAGIGGAESTTSLNRLLQGIIQPSVALSEQLEKMGYESGAAALEQDGLRVVMEKLRHATGGNITALLEYFPEIRAARGALALMANEGKNYNRVADMIEDKNARAGATQRTFNEQMKAAGNQLTLLKNQIDATAITIGLKLIPGLLAGIDGLRDVGSSIGDISALLAQQFGPGLSDIMSILDDLWSMLTTVADALWSVGEPIAKLGIGALAETFNDLFAAISAITGPIADNEAAVLALAVAWAIFAAGGIGAIAGNVGAAAILALTGMLRGVEGLQAGLVAGRAGMGAFVASVGPLVAVAALVYGAVSAWQQHTQAVKETEDALKGADDAMQSGSVVSLKSELDDLQELIAKRKKLLAEYGDENSFSYNIKALNPLNWKDMLNATDAERDAAAIDGALKQTQDSLESLGAGATVLAQQMGLVDPERAQQLMTALSTGDPSAIEEIDGLIQQMTPKLEEAGVTAHMMQTALAAVKVGEDGTIDSSSLVALQEVLGQVNSESGRTEAAQQDVAQAFLEASNGATDAATAADDLKKSLDALTGSAMGVDAAGIEWRQGLADLTKSLKETGGGIEGNSLAAGENRLAIQGQIEKMQDLLVAQAQNGAGAEKLSATLGKSRAALIEAGQAAGVSAGDMKALLRQYKLTPDLVQTLIREHGGKDVKKLLQDLQKEADKVDKKKPTIGVGVTTKKGRAELLAMQEQSDKLGLTKPTVKAEAKAEKAREDLIDLGKTADDVDKKKADIPTSAPGASEAKRQLDAARSSAMLLDGTVATVTTVHNTVSKAKQADGGAYPMGVFANGKLPSQATIQPGSGKGLVNWAEGETGGEAFIPMGTSKRARSTQILGDVAGQFGYELTDMESYANGKFPPFRFHFRPRGKKEKPQAYERAKKDARFERYEAWEDNRNLFLIATGQRGEGKFQAVAGDPGATMGNLDAAKEAQAQARAELAAKRSKNPYDTAEDFYKKPTVTIKDYIKALNASITATESWGKDISKISGKVGPDVVATLQAMGEDGEKWIKKLATASVADMEKMAEKLRKIQFMEFSQGLEQDIKAQQQFAANLATLIRMGRGDLAAQFAEMGYQNAGSLAASAVGMTASELATLASQMNLQDQLSSPGMTDAVVLAGALQSSTTPLGIIGLSRASGKSVGDVVGLLETFNAAVFSQVPPGKMRQIRADQALINDGKQPSGLESGGIVSGSNTGDLYYRWAEKGSGGESLIPHGLDKRSRAKALWETTGRIIGAHSAGGGGGSMYVVSPGAVVVSVDASGQNLTEAQMTRIAKGAADSAMGNLARELTTGKRG